MRCIHAIDRCARRAVKLRRDVAQQRDVENHGHRRPCRPQCKTMLCPQSRNLCTWARRSDISHQTDHWAPPLLLRWASLRAFTGDCCNRLPTSVLAGSEDVDGATFPQSEWIVEQFCSWSVVWEKSCTTESHSSISRMPSCKREYWAVSAPLNR